MTIAVPTAEQSAELRRRSDRPGLHRQAGSAIGTWRLGVLLIAGSAVASSTAGLFTGSIQADAWTVLLWRGLFGGVLIAVWIAWQHGRATFAAFRAIGLPGVLAAGCSTVGTICFINALRQTTVADVTIIFATAPFVAAAVAWLWKRQRPSWVTAAASAVALAGVALMFSGAQSVGHVVGDLLALAMTALIATMMVIIRNSQASSMLPPACLSAFASSIIVLPWANLSMPVGTELLTLALFGAQFGLVLLLLTLGSRLIPAAQSALIGNLELPLAPIWVWLAFGQIPPAMTCLGGAIVLAAIAGDMRLNRARP